MCVSITQGPGHSAAAGSAVSLSGTTGDCGTTVATVSYNGVDLPVTSWECSAGKWVLKFDMPTTIEEPPIVMVSVEQGGVCSDHYDIQVT